MKKAAGRSTTTLEDMERNMAVLSARQGFIEAAFSMGWQLALTILIPVFIGVQVDKKFGTSPSYTLTALFLAIGMGGYVVAQTIKKVSTKQVSRRDKKS
jgi:F0F1-type ATP synthase assembly protein I